MRIPLAASIGVTLGLLFVTHASALPPAEERAAIGNAASAFLTGLEGIGVALAAEKDQHGLAAACLMHDHQQLAQFLDLETTLSTLYFIGLKIKDPDDLKLVDGYFQRTLDGLKAISRTVSGLAAAEPTDCKALPYYVANPTLLDDLAKDALAIVGAFSI